MIDYSLLRWAGEQSLAMRVLSFNIVCMGLWRAGTSNMSFLIWATACGEIVKAMHCMWHDRIPHQNRLAFDHNVQ
jgi:hypothetical protein